MPTYPSYLQVDPADADQKMAGSLNGLCERTIAALLFAAVVATAGRQVTQLDAVNMDTLYTERSQTQSGLQPSIGSRSIPMQPGYRDSVDLNGCKRR